MRIKGFPNCSFEILSAVINYFDFIILFSYLSIKLQPFILGTLISISVMPSLKCEAALIGPVNHRSDILFFSRIALEVKVMLEPSSKNSEVIKTFNWIYLNRLPVENDQGAVNVITKLAV
jgi:hypothetical protein